ncbi:hypothetical protein H2O64_22235 [Kordia sp. YSTF-M3]|uniref:AlgX/AlgJ SGNH hydrolase-like domain-containing protein n=1 Tax=Kordia aestuariivivens TaxID=2759037 RepID=A0ABR7QFR7_9FLAO|nr:hypothetical protein [Kordia aestuariivivens]MBC8757405.1 hypothetical protein [Kordia aestuariivivens]
MKDIVIIAALSIGLWISSNNQNQTAFEEICKEKVTNASSSTIVGEKGWLFLANELAHISKGKFYGTDAAKTSVCPNPDRQDPIPAIVDFNNQLKKLGIKLYLMPVPPKAIVNANKLDASVKVNQSLYTNYKNLYSELANNGVEVIDLFPQFTKSTANGNNTYCQQDSHWNPQGIDVASKILSNNIKKEQWYKDYSGVKKTEKAVQKTILIDGDLKESVSNLNVPKEKISLNTFDKSSSTDKNSPVLIIGDSHTLIFHSGGDMLAENAGLSDNLAAQLGLNVDLIGVKGSGTSSVRIDLYRKAKDAEWLAKKKVIIWCFAARDFSESKNGWRKVPVVK